MVLVHESDPRFGAFDFRAAREKAPPDLQDVLDNHEPLPFRRRGYERDGMLQTLIEHAGLSPQKKAYPAASSQTVISLTASGKRRLTAFAVLQSACRERL
jgi:hypothetical protein